MSLGCNFKKEKNNSNNIIKDDIAFARLEERRRKRDLTSTQPRSLNLGANMG